MASLTEEEDNYFRIFKLVSDLAPKAVREKFEGATINSMTDNEKGTLLINACKRNHEDIVLFLIKEGVDVNKQIGGRHSALMTAYLAGNYKIVELLVDAGANVNKTNEDGKTLLMLIVEGTFYPDLSKYAALSITNDLLDRDADITAADNEGNTVFGLAIKSKFTEAVMILLDRGADINKVNNDGKTPLMLAVEFLANPTAIIKELLDRGARINAADNDGNTVLGLAVKSGFVDDIMILLDRGADINNASNDGKTLLMLVVEFHPNPTAIIKAILDRGAEINAADNDGIPFWD